LACNAISVVAFRRLLLRRIELVPEPAPVAPNWWYYGGNHESLTESDFARMTA